MNRAALLALGVVVSVVTAASAIDITGCDQEVPAGQVGVLTTDLDCGPSTAPGYGVELGRNATLDLQGHTITGPQWAVYCPDRATCTVTSTTGRGTIAGAEAGMWAVASNGAFAKVVASNVDFVGNDYAIANNLKTTLTDVTFTDNGFALTSRSLVATNVTIAGDCTASYCFDLGRGRIDGLVTSGTGAAGNVIQVNKSLIVRNASMQGSPGQAGIIARAIRITDSTVTGHGIDLAARVLRVANVSCGRSRRFGTTGLVIGDWGVCAND